MALPTSRNKTYSPSDSPRSADLNDIQDQIIALNAYHRRRVFKEWSWWRGSSGSDLLATAADGSGSVAFSAATANRDYPQIDLAAVTGAGDRARVYPQGGGILFGAGADRFEIGLEALIQATAGDGRFYLGLHSDPDTTSAPDTPASFEYACFYLDETDTSLHCLAGDGGGNSDNQDSGVVPVAVAATSGYTAMRLEYFGISTPVGVAAGSAVARFYVDGVLVQTLTGTAVPSGGSGLAPFAHVRYDGAGGVQAELGPIWLEAYNITY